jgi:NAD(P)H-flavin reductase
MTVKPYRLRRIRRENADTFTLDLTPESRGDEAPFAPGQFNMLYAFGVGEVPVSISGDPREKGRRVHTVRRVGAVTRALTALRRNDTVGLRGPFGRGWPIEEVLGLDVAVVAGGIGLAPLKPAFHALLTQRRDFGRLRLLYGARTPAEMIFRGELSRWSRRGDLDVITTVDRAGPGWRGNVGVVTALFPGIDWDRSRTAAFVCGPEIMIRFAARALMELGIAAERIFVSLERNMKCGCGLCGHCQCGPFFVCKDGPVFALPRVSRLLAEPEL